MTSRLLRRFSVFALAVLLTRVAVADEPLTLKDLGAVSNVHRDKKGDVFLDVGPHYPNQTISVVVFGADATAFPAGYLEKFQGKHVWVAGEAHLYRGKPQYIVRSPVEIALRE